jgi:hypothetical protein
MQGNSAASDRPLSELSRLSAFQLCISKVLQVQVIQHLKKDLCLKHAIRKMKMKNVEFVIFKTNLEKEKEKNHLKFSPTFID